MPAEWVPHEATWLAWPTNRADWPGKFPPIPWVYAEIVRHLHTGERVHLLVDDADARILMTEFYRRMRAEKKSPLEALRLAQLAVYRPTVH